MSTAVAFQAYGGFPGSGKTKDGEVLLGTKKMSDGFFIEEEDETSQEVLTSSSSIGAPSPSSSSIGEDSSSEAGEEGEEEEVESKLKQEPGLGCLEALEDSLPIKQGVAWRFQCLLGGCVGAATSASVLSLQPRPVEWIAGRAGSCFSLS